MIYEYFDVDVENGKIYNKKTRSGSNKKIGDEITGTKRNGYVDIRIQKARDGFTGASIPRSHLVWWKATGHWPTGVIDHDNGIRNDDRIENLRDATFRENALNKSNTARKHPPNVSVYKPTGREHLLHYGKFVFQKQYKGVQIRVGYYNTPEEALIKGAEDWEKRVQDDWVAKPVHSAKLTKEQVEEIRSSRLSIYKLAKKHKVAPQTIWSVKKFKTHKTEE